MTEHSLCCLPLGPCPHTMTLRDYFKQWHNTILKALNAKRKRKILLEKKQILLEQSTEVFRQVFRQVPGPTSDDYRNIGIKCSQFCEMSGRAPTTTEMVEIINLTIWRPLSQPASSSSSSPWCWQYDYQTAWSDIGQSASVCWQSDTAQHARQAQHAWV